ncbi:MAG: sigma-54-dependent Fis family transcriptional regulator [Phycisphaeraceae bacterium]|nr:sigma-54-dependent Fis family transcriptional regulator [Phycisphaeraceae bacterium]MCW5761692.1 sigma-54-dependent Fis family transcriptional regulator [Phycisphaeraceae bacterium]
MDESLNSVDRARHAGAQVLIVDDEAEHADVMADALRKPGHICTIVGSVDEAMKELDGGAFDVIVTDLRMPSSAGQHGTSADGGDAGLRVLEAARQMQPEAETIMVTAHGDVPTARAAFKFGAFDFIEKPLDLELFRSLVQRAAENVMLRHESGDLSPLVQHDGFEGIIAGSEQMRRILRVVRTVAASTISVLITGESGTGKELVARAVHENSKRKGKRFVAFNCAGQSESLIEDQLFGHVRGAYTGADKDREGVFEYADGGTLFLDEIGDMPLSMQAKLLRVLESGEVVRLGSNEARKVDVRFVSATNRDLRELIVRGEFREDLFFRINGSHVTLPPLRERRDDIPRIVRHAIGKFAAEVAPKQPAPAISDSALLRLTSYDWPGNVRQLLNVVQNMVITAAGEGEGSIRLDVRHIPDDIRSDAGDGASEGVAGALAGTSLEQLEKRAIRETLGMTGGNREHAAKLLGIGERTLYRKLKEYGLR